MGKRADKSRLLYLIPLIGTIFCIGYILAASEDVVYSDYIRLVNSYLPDVWDPKKFFVADILTRIPVNFLERIVNVTFFGYSTTFEMILGALCHGVAAVLLTSYCRKRKLGFIWYLFLMVFFFSLNKWEMLTNGTGWCHFLAFAGFYCHYMIWDRVWARQMAKSARPLDGTQRAAGARRDKVRARGLAGARRDKAGAGGLALADDEAEIQAQDKRDRIWLQVLPWLITLGTAGPYCGSYSAVLLLTYGICFLLDWADKKRPDFRHLLYSLHVLLPLGLYMLSSSCVVPDPTDPLGTGRSFSQVFQDDPTLFPKFLLKGFASMVMGEEVMLELLTELDKGMLLCYLAGLLVLAGYLLALWLQVRRKLYRTTILPLMLLFGGGLNHLLVLAARWVFERSSYGMSSRYALQYQIGIIGIILTIGLVFGQRVKEKRWVFAEKTAALLLTILLLMGNVYTTCKELEKAPYRRLYTEDLKEAALHYEEIEDEELARLFQYSHGPEKIRQALGILKEQQWNVYREH